jgi:hypothetical protein
MMDGLAMATLRKMNEHDHEACDLRISYLWTRINMNPAECIYLDDVGHILLPGSFAGCMVSRPQCQIWVARGILSLVIWMETRMINYGIWSRFRDNPQTLGMVWPPRVSGHLWRHLPWVSHAAGGIDLLRVLGARWQRQRAKRFSKIMICWHRWVMIQDFLSGFNPNVEI